MNKRLLICLFLLLSYRGYGQSCTLSVTISQSSPSICSGEGVVLTAVPSGGTAPFTYIWSTGETTSSITVNKAGTYTVSVSDKTPGCQPVKKSISVTESTTPDAPTAKGTTVCQHSSATLTATAPGGFYEWYDAPTAGNFLGSGDTYTTPPINSSTTFYVETTISNCTSPRTAVTVNINGKPTVTGATTCPGNVATLMASGGDTYAWYDAATGGNEVGTDADYTTPPLTATKTYYVVVTSNGCTSDPTPVTATVSKAPSPPTASGQSICQGGTANLHADGPAGSIFDWFNVPSGGTSLISSPDYTTPPLSATTTYYVQITVNDCASDRVPVTVTVDSPPQPPDAQTDTTCYQTSITLTASANPSGTYKWYSAATGGSLLTTGVTYTTPALTNSTSYYVQAVNGSCVSSRAQVNVIVRPQLSAPSASGAIICSGSAATLTATSPGGTYQWYSAATGGTFLAGGASYTTPALKANTTFYVQRMQWGCTSPRTAVTVSVLSPPSPPTAPNATVCSGNSATLTASGSANNYAWYDAATGGNLLSTGQVYVTPALTANTTYYVETSNANGCTSTRTPVKVTVTPDPSPPTASGTSVCPGTSATLTASAPSGTIQWYDSASDGTPLATGNTYNTPVLTATTTFYVQNTSAQCSSSRTPVTVKVISVPYPQFQYSSGTFCSTGPDQTPVINNPSGGTFSAAPSGLVFVNTSTGEINIAASAAGKYIVSFASNGPCPSTTSANIAIVTTTDARFSYAGPYCQDGTNPFPKFPAGATAGTFSASPAGLAFVNTSTGEINLAKSDPGTYTVTNTIKANGSCPASVATASVTIYQQVLVDAGPDQTVETGSTVQLSGSISGGATTGTWSGGSGSFSDASSLNPVYTPGPGETVAKLTLTSANPPGPCGAKSANVTITFNPQPNTPTAQGTTVCYGSSATLSATAPGGTYRWYDSASGGTLLATGPSFTTPALTADISYYVQTTQGGITSSRTMVTVTVGAVPAAPVASGAQICAGTSATLTASGSAGSYEWYNVATEGNLLSDSSTYTTARLSSNTSYYVQSKVNGCTSTRTKVDVTVNPIPNITSAATGSVCSGDALNYTITADQPSATFTWSRAKVAGISNPAVSDQTTSAINETLINTGGANVNVTYLITPMSGGCSGPSFNYVVTVYPIPAVTSADSATICDGTTDNYTVKYNVAGTDFSWSRAAVPGISNAPVSGQSASTIKEVLFNTTTNPVDVNYVFNAKTNACTGVPFNLKIKVNPKAIITSDSSGVACSGSPQDYIITSNIPATFIWSRNAQANISNPAVSDQTSGTITESLVNTRSTPVNVTYNITPIANGCDGTPFKYIVTVNPSVNTPAVRNNSPVCLDSTIHLNTNTVANATYMWTGPNGYTSASQNPVITNATAANSGIYTLVNIIKGCDSKPAYDTVMVNQPPVADAGPDQVVCINNPSVILNGSISGGTTTGIWSTSGTGVFMPSANTLTNVKYVFSDADKASGSVVLTLTSTSKDNCTVATSSMTVRFGLLQGVNAGPDQDVCSQDVSVPLNGKQLTTGSIEWVSSGSGNFSPSANQLDPNYIPTAADIQKGSVTLTLNITGAGPCYSSADSMIVKFIPPPKVYAGGTRYVLKGRAITLYPVVNTDSVHYLWSPDIDINNDTLKNPVVTGDVDRTYTLTVTDYRGCVSQDTTLIKVSPPININNTFTPNGDGINDQWNITGLIAYVDATVDIFTRYGQKVFHSVGYPKPWDGTYNGKPLPAGVYYYIINTHVNGQVLSGYVTIIR